MKFAAALERLRSMSPGYCSIHFTITVHFDGSVVPQCSVYTPEHHTTYPPKATWEEALQDLQNKIDETTPDPMEGAPE